MEKEKRVRIYSESEKEYRREAQRKRMENPEYRERKRLSDRKRLEDKEVRARKQAMDRAHSKTPDRMARNVEAHRKFRDTDKYKEWVNVRAGGEREAWLSDNAGKVCTIVLVKCLDCGCCEVKRPRLVKDCKASSAYCSTHAKAHRRSHGVDYKRFNIICSDCGVECLGAGNRKVCEPCRKNRQRALKKTREAIDAKRLLGGSLRQRARRRGCYVDTVRPNIVFERDKWRCVECGVKVVRSRHWQPNQATVDHAIPLSRGGSHTYENCQIMCMMCNSKKEASMPVGRQLTVFDRVV